MNRIHTSTVMDPSAGLDTMTSLGGGYGVLTAIPNGGVSHPTTTTTTTTTSLGQDLL